MTEQEHAELERLQAFVDRLGLSEMEDADFARYLHLLTLAKEEV